MHLTLGILRRFQAFSYASAFFSVDRFTTPPPAQVTQAVETVEKVPFQKRFLKSGTETLKST